MPTPLSKVLGVTHDQLVAQGAFDGFVDVDSRLYVDPHLLSETPIPELQQSHGRFRHHFEQVLRVLKAAAGRPPAFREAAIELLTFHELPNTGLGYAKNDTEGSAIGTKLASGLADLGRAIVEAGVEDPEIFELVGLLQEGVGADRISDMTIDVILPDLLAFTQRVGAALRVPVQDFRVRGTNYKLPVNPGNGGYIVLIPQVLLRDLPVADSWSDIDYVTYENEELRRRVNTTIGATWRHATRRISKAELRAALLRNPELLKDLLSKYHKKPAEPYDFVADPAAQQLWFYLSQEEALKDPLDLAAYKPTTGINAIEVVVRICDKYKTLVEANRLYRILYNDDGSRRHERIAQLGFFAVADCYCEANDLDLSPEVNSGPGPVDFKISAGYKDRLTVEIKLSSNANLVHGFAEQLPLYNGAEQARHSFFVIIRVDENVTRINAVQALRTTWLAKGLRVPDVVVIDGRPQLPASRARRDR